MKKWSWGINGLHRICGVTLTEEPWWVEPFTNALTWACEHTLRIPLPFMKWFKHIDEDGDYCTCAEYYGDNLRSVFCGLVHLPLSNWAHGKEKTIYHMNIGWDKGKELFYNENPQVWNEEEKEDHDANA
jgi:hypothetical protein